MHEEPRDPALDQLDALAGEWDIEATHPLIPNVIRGRATFEWLPGKRFLIWRGDAPPNTVPSSISIIGGPKSPWPMRYFDSRGVERTYQVSMDGGIWKMWRDEPGFRQRSTGVFEDGGRVFRVKGELQEKDEPWKADLSAVYRRR